MEKSPVKSERHKKVGELHENSLQWKSTLLFMDEEILFLDHLLDSYNFEPDTPDLFERLQNYQDGLVNAKIGRSKVNAQIIKHESNLGGMLESGDSTSDLGFYQEHDKIKTEVEKCLSDFQNLKSEIFNYAIGLMKKRKNKNLV